MFMQFGWSYEEKKMQIDYNDHQHRLGILDCFLSVAYEPSITNYLYAEVIWAAVMCSHHTFNVSVIFFYRITDWITWAHMTFLSSTWWGPTVSSMKVKFETFICDLLLLVLCMFFFFYVISAWILLLSFNFSSNKQRSYILCGLPLKLDYDEHSWTLPHD